MELVEVLREDEAVVPEFPHGDARCVDIAIVLPDCLEEAVEGLRFRANLVLWVALPSQREVEFDLVLVRIAGGAEHDIGPALGAYEVGDILDRGRSTSRGHFVSCLLYTSPSPRDATLSRMPSSA